ncbi:MAG: Uncharacterised protein [Prochlorococcus marinus str. MIT 9215]|nr:MAG: Uncharacterised protein [Prochlorococcus marinus str. MIT 9215]
MRRLKSHKKKGDWIHPLNVFVVFAALKFVVETVLFEA